MRKVLIQSVAVAAVLSMSTPIYAGDITPFSGDINPFSGDINPFSGDINPFSGDINPFRGDIDPFYGDISPFWGDTSSFWGDVSPYGGDAAFWGTLSTSNSVNGQSVYWETVGPMWGDINKKWAGLGTYDASSSYDYFLLRNDLNAMITLTEAQWGAQIFAATGQNARPGFVDPLLAKYGLTYSNLSTFDDLTAAERSAFFMDWYDGLMVYSGQDRVDHWMPQVNWSPALTQDQGEGHDAIVGLLDVRISANDDNLDYLNNIGGYAVSAHEHGAAVASLIAARHDGEGLMGIAPRATINAYAPFDATGSSSIADVATGIAALTNSGANVINMSLGLPTWTMHQDIANIFLTPEAQAASATTTFVIASGNEGIVQTTDVNWAAGANFSNLLVVGSVDPNSNISFFSNTPGETCLLVGGVCNEDNKLKNRFLVAPGELILVSDNNGGTTRMSGTSFAAPIVTGAVSLVHDRWPWLQDHSDVTTDIILQTATDLGAPGVDAVYGHGLLNIEAAQSPLNYDDLTIYVPNSNGGLQQQSSGAFKNSFLSSGSLDLWELQGAKIFAIETIGNTYRDFTIPLSTSLHGQSGTFQGNTEQYQRHVQKGLTEWLGTTSFASETSVATPIGNTAGFDIAMLASASTSATNDKSFNSGLSLKSHKRGLSLRMGEGMDIVSLSDNGKIAGFTGNISGTEAGNPYLSLAAGGSFAAVDKEVGKNFIVSLGMSELKDDHSYIDEQTGQQVLDDVQFDKTEASAAYASVSYQPTRKLRLDVTYTRLDEQTGMLGAQGVGAFALDSGAISNALTIGADYQVTPTLRLSAATTAGETESYAQSDQILRIGEGGLTSTSFLVSARKDSVFKRNDRFKLSFSQPLHVEDGDLTYNSVQVTDRSTGELGQVEERWRLGGGARHIITEAEYSFPVMKDNGEFSVFGRIDTGDVDVAGEYEEAATGLRFSVKF